MSGQRLPQPQQLDVFADPIEYRQIVSLLRRIHNQGQIAPADNRQRNLHFSSENAPTGDQMWS